MFLVGMNIKPPKKTIACAKGKKNGKWPSSFFVFFYNHWVLFLCISSFVCFLRWWVCCSEAYSKAPHINSVFEETITVFAPVNTINPHTNTRINQDGPHLQPCPAVILSRRGLLWARDGDMYEASAFGFGTLTCIIVRIFWPTKLKIKCEDIVEVFFKRKC